MSGNENKSSRLLVVFAAVLVIAVIVIGARWSGFTLTMFRSELDRPIMEIDPEPPENTHPWELGIIRSRPPSGNLSELDLCTSKAQYNLPKFIKALSSPTSTQSDFSVCARMPAHDDGGSCLFWFRVVRTAPGRFSATIIPTYNRDELFAEENYEYRSCEITDEEIVDWVYFDDGKMVGGYTAGYFHRNR